MLGNLRDLWAFYRKCLKVWKSKSRSFDSHPIYEDLSPGTPVSLRSLRRTKLVIA
jgi:hypothetical protein